MADFHKHDFLPNLEKKEYAARLYNWDKFNIWRNTD